jgi:hypothetical protein
MHAAAAYPRGRLPPGAKPVPTGAGETGALLVSKLLRDPLPERHLYLRVGGKRAAIPVVGSVAHGVQAATRAAAPPGRITHLWLVPSLGATVLAWSPMG